MLEPTASISPLTRSDGSAVYSCPATGFQILGSVNGPIELPARRDAQKPEEATVEVLVKPATAQSAIGERYVEIILRTLLSRVILGREKGFARRGVVVTLLVLGSSGDGKTGRGESVSLPRPLVRVNLGYGLDTNNHVSGRHSIYLHYLRFYTQPFLRYYQLPYHCQ